MVVSLVESTRLQNDYRNKQGGAQPSVLLKWQLVGIAKGPVFLVLNNDIAIGGLIPVVGSSVVNGYGPRN